MQEQDATNQSGCATSKESVSCEFTSSAPAWVDTIQHRLDWTITSEIL
jgi:hypothetical protein